MEDVERIFTRSEALGVLPRLRPMLEDIRQEWGRIRELNPNIQKARDKSALDGHSPDGVEYVESVSHMMLVMNQIREMGVLVKDLDKGLVDFPYLKDDRVVYLCWHLGEDSIDYWHEIESGFGGREPLDEGDL